MKIEKKFNDDKINSIVLELSDMIDLVLTPNLKTKNVNLLMRDKISNVMDLSEDITNEDIKHVISAFREIWITLNK